MDTNLDEIKSIISSRRHFTNCFSYFNEIESWFKKDLAHGYAIDGCAFLFFKIHGFYKFYYYVKSFADIALANDLLNQYGATSDISLEFTTKHHKNVDELTQAIGPIGFSFYAEYVRVNTGKSQYTFGAEDGNEAEYEVATLQDKDELLEIMHREFNVISDDVPTEEELIELINDEAVLVRHMEGRIIFIQMYEFSKGLLYHRMTWAEKKYRKPKYTIELYSGVIRYVRKRLGGTTENIRSTGWLDKTNKNFEINIKSGAEPDGTTCSIFLYNPKASNEN